MSKLNPQTSDGFRLPKSLELGGVGISVKPSEKLFEHHQAYGLTLYDKALILVDSELSGDLLPITYWHEVVHNIFNTLGRNTLRDDEELVDSVANLLWQAQKTAKF